MSIKFPDFLHQTDEQRFDDAVKSIENGIKNMKVGDEFTIRRKTGEHGSPYFLISWPTK